VQINDKYEFPVENEFIPQSVDLNLGE